MSSDRRIGKYREKTQRTRTPYARPKGFMRRVTDSVSGFLGSSWIPGFLRGDEDQNQQAGPSGYSRGAASNSPPSPRSLHPIYPEEAGCEENGDNSASNSVAGLSTNSASNNHRINFSASGHNSPASLLSGPATSQKDGGVVHSNLMLGGSGSSSSIVGLDSVMSDRYTNAGNSSAILKPYAASHAGHSSKLTCTTPATRFTVDAAPNVRPAEVQTDRGVADCLSEEQPPFVSQCRPVPSSSALASRLSTPGDSRAPPELTASSRLSAAQSASKRPRFSLAAYNAAASPPGNKSILSDGSFRSSPFYPGRTIYGGAASYSRTPTPVTPSRASTASPRPGTDGGLSEAAKKILTCLNAMSTPLTDAKRIPTPSASPYASYLDSPYTAAFHRHRPQQRRPPTSSISTPAKAGVQSNFAQYVVPHQAPSIASSSSSRVPELLPVSSSRDHSVLHPGSSLNPSDEQPSIFSVAAASSAPRSPASSLKSRNTGESSSSNPLLQPDKPVLEAGSSAALCVRTSPSSAVAFPSTSSATAPPISSESSSPLRRQDSALSWPYVDEVAAAGGGKIRPAFKPRLTRKDQEKEFDLPDEPPVLPNVSLPKVNFSAPIPLSGMMKPPAQEGSTARSLAGEKGSREGFEFRAPEILHDPASKQKDKSASKNGSSSNFSEDSTTSIFNFSTPVSVITDQNSKDNFVVPKPSLVPKLKTVSPLKNVTSEVTRDLIPSSSGLLEFLNKSNSNSPQSTASNKESNPPKKSEETSGKESFEGFGDRFKAAAGSWECDTCMVRNSADKCRCVACDTAKPGSSTSLGSSSGAVVAPNLNNTASGASSALPTPFTIAKPSQSGFGDAFKRAATDWECSTCLVNNKGDALQCIACLSAKPGASSSSNASNSVLGANSVSSSSTSFSFGVPSTSVVTTTVTSTFSFGAKPSSTVASSSTFSSSTKPSSTVATSSSTFSFGLKPSSTASQKTSTFNFGVSSTVPSSSAAASCFGVASTISTTSVSSNFSFTSPSNAQSEAVKKTSESSISDDSVPASTKSPNDWDCLSCLQRNTAERCTSCDALKPGLESSSSSIVNTSCSSLPSSGFGDKFKKSIGDWECEVCMVSNKADIEKCVACESSKPGSTSSVKSSLGGTYKFGSSSKPTDNSGFKFGLAASNCAKNALSDTPKISETSTGFSFAAPSVTSSATSTSSFVFSANNSAASTTQPSKPTFSFGAQPMSNSNGSIHGQGPPASLKFLAPSNDSTVSVDKPAEKTASLLPDFKASNEMSTPPNMDSNLKKINAGLFTFGAPASKSDGLAVASPVKNPSFSTTVPDASKSGSFFNSTPAMNSSDQVNVGKKRSLKPDDDDESSNKISNSPFSKNNGFAESSSQFSFGKSASAVTPSFQFNSAANTNAPSFGNFSSSFGGSAPTGGMFSGINNNNNINDGLKPGAAPTPTFAFGQPAEKKASTGFDFGQAATPAPAFNFTAAAPSAFQFSQQTPNAKTGGGGGVGATNNGVFQFGSGAAAAATPSLGMSSGNPFSQTQSAAPHGRLVKKAVRRTKK